MSRRFLAAVLIFMLGLLSGCGQSTYEERMDDKMRDLKRSTPESNDTGDETSADEAAPDSTTE